MIKGTVKFFNGTKGFGFITPDDGTKEVFVPSATVNSSGAGSLKAGQRVSFEAEQEAKGPKAVRLALLDEPLREQPKEAPRASITVYYEAEDEDAADVMGALSAAGYSARQIDYTLNPPSREELKKLSVMLREANQSLARRYEPLFMELQLDDRFISEAEFLTGIHEHPTLINGPIVVGPGKARICRTAEDVQTFLHNGAAEEKRPKGISPRMAAMMQGQAVPPAPVAETRQMETPAKSVMIEEPEPKPVAKVRLAPRPGRVAAAVMAVAEAPAPVPAKKPAKVAPAKPVKAVPVKAVKVAKAVKAKAPAKPVKKAKK